MEVGLGVAISDVDGCSDRLVGAGRTGAERPPADEHAATGATVARKARTSTDVRRLTRASAEL
jgi:hypothetical protein